MAYSSKINDPAFDKFVQSTKKWSFQFSLILAVIAVAGFTIYGAVSDEMDNPEALLIGAVIGAMFLLIGIFSGKSKAQKTTWDGVVVDKKIKKTKKDIGYDTKVDRLVYKVLVKSESGKVHEIRNEDDSTVFNYYNIGDKVRHHGSLNTYEKFDKTADSIIFCNACGFLHDIHEDVCRNCKCPLLK